MSRTSGGHEPTITVCVPTVGRTESLKMTLQSLRAQAYGDYNVLILDNASGPEAQEEIARYVAGEPRASVLRAPVRLPMFENFQRGADAAVGRYLTYFHDDDIYCENFLKRNVELLDAHPRAAFSGSNCTLIDAKGVVIGSRDMVQASGVWPGWRYIRTLFAAGSNVVPMQSIVLRRELLQPRTFASAESIHYSDFLLLMRLAEKHEVGLIAERLIQLRVHDQQASQQIDIGSALELRTRIFDGYCDELLTRWPERKAEIEQFRKSIGPARRSAAVWAWMNAKDGGAAASSRAAVLTQSSGRWVLGALTIADWSGLSRLLRTARVRSVVRRIAHTMAVRRSASNTAG